MLVQIEEPDRKLAAILAADVVGFSRMLGTDETGTLARLAAAREDLVDPLLASHRGRIFKVMGDGLLVEFPSVVLALRAAIAVQLRMQTHNLALPPEERIVLRIGLHQGDVVVNDTDLLGDGVNVAVRLERLAEPGGICISARVREDVVGKIPLAIEDGGMQVLKNISQPIRVFRIRPGAEPCVTRASQQDAMADADGNETIVIPPPSSRHRLVLLEALPSGEQRSRDVPLTGTPLTIGRQAPSDLILSGGGVSRAHCRFELVEDAVVLTDLHSTNGTFVDEQRITVPQRLEPGARVRVGPHLLQYVVRE
jgi:class 3 adenylate cyclase